MRVIDLDTGDTLQAANDDDLRKAVAGFYADRNEPMSEDDVAQLVEPRAYDATDSCPPPPSRRAPTRSSTSSASTRSARWPWTACRRRTPAIRARRWRSP